MRSRLALVLCALLTAGLAAVVSAAPASAEAGTGRYVAVTTPTRVLDTRKTGAIGPGKTVSFGVPTGATSVVLNVTVTAPTAGGYITAYKYGITPPATSNLNFVKGQTVPNLVVAPVGSGRVSLLNGSKGSVQLLVDISGYFAGGAPGQGGFGSVGPTRLLNTRAGAGVPVGAKQSVTFQASGGSTGVPPDASAVVLNVTATEPTASGYITAYPGGPTPPSASNLNFTTGQTVPNLVVVPVGSDGQVTLYNGSNGTVQLLADVQGYFAAGDPTTAGALGALAPARLLDTRPTAVPHGGTAILKVAGRGGVPLSAVSAVVLNVTVTGPTSSGYITAYSGSKPGVSNLNYAKGQTVANLVVVKPDSLGRVNFYNGSSGTVQLIADVSGYVLGQPLSVPATSTSRYVRNITDGGPADQATMHDEGCADATSAFVLLDIGAQLNNTTGVQLSATSTNLTYAQLVSALNAYLGGYGTCGGTGTVAVATNNSGVFTTYTAAARGTDWADKVIDQLTPSSGVTVAGADDIESGFEFGSTEAQAEQWETAYLAATDKQLRFVGSADGCPTSYGTTGTTCDPGWTQASYYRLSYSLNTSRIRALPQIYTEGQATQWANIAKTGGAKTGGATIGWFVGALTENAACPMVQPGCSFASQTAPQGWAALYHALSTVVTTPTLPYVTDLQIDG